MKYKVILSFALLVFACNVNAQVLYFNGLGRAIVTNDALSGAILNNDTKTTRRGTGGYTLLDLGINVQPSEYLRASATIRAKNAFGGFYGDGSVITFRQIKLDGIISKKVKYEIGDIDLSLSPYTLFNFYESYYDHEAEIFLARRKIVNYENFNNGNKWRLQGANITANLGFNKGIEKIGIQAFVTRIVSANYFNNIIPDRLQYGGHIDLLQSKFFQAGLNYIALTDLAGTSPSPAAVLHNQVMTGDFKINFDVSNVTFSIYGEGGGSKYTYTAKDSTRSKEDYFYDAGVSSNYKPMKLKLFANYRNVGSAFNSPGAQTRRMFDMGNAALFPTYIENAANINRTPSLLDRYSDDAKLRNTTIMDTLIRYDPKYNNISPYGIATPNRQGFTFGVALGADDKILKADVTLDLLSEVREETNNGKRKYMGIKGGFTFNIHNLLHLQKMIVLNGGIGYEHTTRSAPTAINLTSNLIDAGLVIEVLKGLDVLGGYKVLMATGKEFYRTMDVFNEVVSDPIIKNFNYAQSVIATGLRYRHSKNAFTTVQWHIVNVNDKDQTHPLSYQINQVFINYTLVF